MLESFPIPRFSSMRSIKRSLKQWLELLKWRPFPVTVDRMFPVEVNDVVTGHDFQPYSEPFFAD